VSGRHNFRKLREKIERDLERRERMQEIRKAYDAILNLAIGRGWVWEPDDGRRVS
jgi:hypothetical protein